MDPFGAPVGWIRAPLDVAASLQVVDQFSHRLRGHPGPSGQLAEPLPVHVRKVLEDVAVRRTKVGEPGSRDEPEDAARQRVVGGLEQRGCGWSDRNFGHGLDVKERIPYIQGTLAMEGGIARRA